MNDDLYRRKTSHDLRLLISSPCCCSSSTFWPGNIWQVARWYLQILQQLSMHRLHYHHDYFHHLVFDYHLFDPWLSLNLCTKRVGKFVDKNLGLVLRVSYIIDIVTYDVGCWSHLSQIGDFGDFTEGVTLPRQCRYNLSLALHALFMFFFHKRPTKLGKTYSQKFSRRQIFALFAQDLEN